MLKKIFYSKLAVFVYGVIFGLCIGYIVLGRVFPKVEDKEIPRTRVDIQEKKSLTEMLLGDAEDFPDHEMSSEYSREDNDFVYYEIDIPGADKSKVKVEVKDGLISISGELDEGSENSEVKISSRFHRSFSAPNNIETQKVQIDQQGSKLILKFPKK